MVNKLDVKTTALAVGTTAAVLYILCVVFYTLAPELANSFFADISHGIDITPLIRTTPVPLSSTIAGFVEITISGFLVGALFAKIYNYFVKRQ